MLIGQADEALDAGYGPLSSATSPWST